MSTMSQMLDVVEDLRSKIEMPEISDPYLRVVWCMGRNAGATKVRDHVRHHVTEAFPHLKVAPKAVRQEMGQKASDVWLNGYNASVEYVQTKINAIVFHATRGQIMATR